jgi:hypothetical protein
VPARNSSLRAAIRAVRQLLRQPEAAVHGGVEEPVDLNDPPAAEAQQVDRAQQSTASRPKDGGKLYVATPVLLAHYGIDPNTIDPNTIDPNADLLTSRPGLASTAHLQLSGFHPGLVIPGGPGPGDAAGSDHSGCAPGSAPGGCVANPAIQTLLQLPTDTADPNLLITTHGMDKLSSLGLQAVPSAWVIQTARPLTARQPLE